jgi:hypothetical protein
VITRSQADIRRRIELFFILRGGVRHVRTEAGVKKYGLPIGSPITAEALAAVAARKAAASKPAASVAPKASAPPAPKVAAPARAAAKKATGRPPATPVDIHKLFDADDATIERAMRDVYEGQFGPYTTKVKKVYITRAGTRTDKRGRAHQVEPSIGVAGKVYDAQGNEIGYFGRGISAAVLHHGDSARREVWASHDIVQLGEGDHDPNPTRYHGKGFGGAFNGRAIDWYRASGVHGIDQSDHNGYVWASQGFGFRGGVWPDYKQDELRELIAALRAGRTKDQYSQTIPKQLRDAPDLDQQIAAAEAMLARARSAKPGEPGYPTAYEVSQLGRGKRRGKTSTWLGKFLGVSADEMILNPDEGEDVTRSVVQVQPDPLVVKRQNMLFDLWTHYAIAHGDDPEYDPDDDPDFVAQAHR